MLNIVSESLSVDHQGYADVLIVKRIPKKTNTMIHVKIFLRVCSVFIIQQVYHVMNKYI